MPLCGETNKRLMKKIGLMAAMLTGAILLSGNVSSQAQDAGGARKEQRRGGPMSVEQQLDRMAKQLDLTDAQKPKVKALLEDMNKKRQELSSLQGQERREKMTALREEQEKKLKEILTKDQYSKYEKSRDEMRQKAKDRAPGKKKDAA